jgi:alkylation response protein AidB-like acyl-CoA dehydrogenase
MAAAGPSEAGTVGEVSGILKASTGVHDALSGRVATVAGTLAAMDLDLSEHAPCATRSATSMLTEVAPVVEAHERERRFPVEIVRRIGELGWLGIPIPRTRAAPGSTRSPTPSRSRRSAGSGAHSG